MSGVCDSCEKPVPFGIAVCPHCGKRQTTPAEHRQRLVRALIAVALAILVMAAAAKLGLFR